MFQLLKGLSISAMVLIAGAANSFIMFILWILYHALVNVGQTWYSVKLETTCLGINKI